MNRVSIFLASLFLVACSQPPRGEAPAPKPASGGGLTFSESFWRVWSDGQAELAAYELRYPRYNQSRRGVAVTIFVTEPFSQSQRIKADPGKHPSEDVFPVMKLNLIKDYQTGIYDYNDMASVFVALAPSGGLPAGATSKISFSSQEWCGHVWHQVLFYPGRLQSDHHSYFDGEADQRQELSIPADGLAEDALWHWARGMALPELHPGEEREAPLLISLQKARHAHVPLQVVRARLSRAAQTQRVKTVLGEIEVEQMSMRLQDGFTRTFLVEKASPHRIVQWNSSAGEEAVLLGVERMKYWELNREGGERALEKLGLKARPPKTT